VIDRIWLPFPEERLRSHLLPRPDGADALAEWRDPATFRFDPRVWTACCLLAFLDAGGSNLAALLRRAFGHDIGASDLGESPRVTFDVPLRAPSPGRVVHPVPALAPIRDEPPVHVTAVIRGEGPFCVLVAAWVLGDAEERVPHDVTRDELVRLVDAMLEPPAPPIANRTVEATRLLVLCPQIFVDYPEFRRYASHLVAWRRNPLKLAQVLPHRDVSGVVDRIGWLSFEDCDRVLPGALPWLHGDGHVE
jgi:hypothetical protein